MQDTTIIYYTANKLPQKFMNTMLETLQNTIKDTPVIAVSSLPVFIAPPKNWTNLLVDFPYHHLSIYKQALLGAKEAKTKFLHFCEDDVLYAPEHFKYRPSPKKFAYNMNFWNITTWGTPMFTQKLGGRRNLSQLICERDLFVDAMQERFSKHGDDVDISIFAEPSRYEKQLGVTIREHEVFTTNPPNIIFSHQTSLSFKNLGTRKRLGETRAEQVPYWGRAEDVVKLYQ